MESKINNLVGAHTNLFRAINKIEMAPVICTRKYKDQRNILGGQGRGLIILFRWY